MAEHFFESIDFVPSRVCVEDEEVVSVHHENDETLTGLKSDVAQFIQIDHGGIRVLALHVDASLSAGLHKQRQGVFNPSSERGTPDGTRLVGAVQSAFEVPAEACGQFEQWEAW